MQEPALSEFCTFPFITGGFSGITQGQLAYVARTNAVLFDKVVEVITSQPEAKIAFAGTMSTYGLDMILDIHRYMTETDLHLVTTPLVKRFLDNNSPFSRFKNHAEDQGYDDQLICKIKVCVCVCGVLGDSIRNLSNLDNTVFVQMF